jgi:hypothetical protein
VGKNRIAMFSALAGRDYDLPLPQAIPFDIDHSGEIWGARWIRVCGPASAMTYRVYVVFSLFRLHLHH